VSCSSSLRQLQENLGAMESAIHWLQRSLGICAAIGIKKEYAPEEYDAFETLTSRYARAIDLIIRKVLRSIDLVEFEEPGTLIDTVNRAEKRSLIDSAADLRLLADLRNEIAHDYIKAELVHAFARTLQFAPRVIALADRIRSYTGKNLTAG
jgi:uncharacterized protein YutE (UPF0331/DUF86 family)